MIYNSNALCHLCKLDTFLLRGPGYWILKPVAVRLEDDRYHIIYRKFLLILLFMLVDFISLWAVYPM